MYFDMIKGAESNNNWYCGFVFGLGRRWLYTRFASPGDHCLIIYVVGFGCRNKRGRWGNALGTYGSTGRRDFDPML